jgi:hypothetical protein
MPNLLMVEVVFEGRNVESGARPQQHRKGQQYPTRLSTQPGQSGSRLHHDENLEKTRYSIVDCTCIFHVFVVARLHPSSKLYHSRDGEFLSPFLMTCRGACDRSDADSLLVLPYARLFARLPPHLPPAMQTLQPEKMSSHLYFKPRRRLHGT